MPVRYKGMGPFPPFCACTFACYILNPTYVMSSLLVYSLMRSDCSCRQADGQPALMPSLPLCYIISNRFSSHA